ncbi:MAG TPA: MBL fold metallo-hydrolase [Terriglobales bacterium]|jgi:glyoxylase-like metal-dependent hydrolase (beta-lactamase superfamily II)
MHVVSSGKQPSTTGQRLALGEFELTAVSDGLYPLDGGAFFGVVPKIMWQRKLPSNDKNQVTSGLNSIVVRTGKHTVLIETGIGNKLSERMLKIYGQPAQLLNNLAAAGFKPEDIDIVINSHLHFDHCGWNTMRVGDKVVPTFPRAEYFVQEGEWQHGRLQLERDSVSYIGDNYDPVIQNGQMRLITGDQEIVPGISVQVFPGHTKHMQAITVVSGGKTACYISDLIPTAAHLDLTWVMAFDLFPLETIESRKRYYSRAIPEKWLTMFTHDPNMPWAYVEEGGLGKMVARPAG